MEPVLSPATLAQSAQREYKPQGMIHATEIKPMQEMYVPSNNPQKPFEDWSLITDTTSDAWKLLHGKGVEFNEDGTISVAGYYAAALGQSYGKPGDRFQVQLENGRWIPIIMADCKQYPNTANGAGWTGTNGHILEMIVWSVPAKVQIHGSYNVLPKYKGRITKIYKEN